MLTRLARMQGRPVLSIPRTSHALYLTFDDGPDPGFTEAVLKTLQTLGCRATFFVVGEKARRNRSILREILAEGHAIGNHSLDHRYGAFFRGRSAMRQWVQKSEELLREVCDGRPSVGFRPPAGVVTPELVGALRDLDMPLVLWNKRFFDTALPWTRKRALGSLSSTAPGSIILLHDRQKTGRRQVFVDTLISYVERAKQKELSFEPLSRELCSPSEE